MSIATALVFYCKYTNIIWLFFFVSYFQTSLQLDLLVWFVCETQNRKFNVGRFSFRRLFIYCYALLACIKPTRSNTTNLLLLRKRTDRSQFWKQLRLLSTVYLAANCTVRRRRHRISSLLYTLLRSVGVGNMCVDSVNDWCMGNIRIACMNVQS